MKENRIRNRFKEDPDLAARKIREFKENERREMALGYYPEVRLNDNL